MPLTVPFHQHLPHLDNWGGGVGALSQQFILTETYFS